MFVNIMKIESIKYTCPKRLVAFAALFTIFVSLGMLVAGMVMAPSGQIHSSVLVAFGEVSTFVCTLLGVNNKSIYSPSKNQI